MRKHYIYKQHIYMYVCASYDNIRWWSTVSGRDALLHGYRHVSCSFSHPLPFHACRHDSPPCSHGRYAFVMRICRVYFGMRQRPCSRRRGTVSLAYIWMFSDFGMRPFAPLPQHARQSARRDSAGLDLAIRRQSDAKDRGKTKCPRLATFLIPREYGTAFKGGPARRERREPSPLER